MDDHRTEGTEPASASQNKLSARTPWKTREGRVISLVSRKGGVGKTTSAVNLGAALALSGHEVLIVGTDPQCGVCRTLGTTPEELPGGLSDIYDKGTLLMDLAQPSPLPGLSFVSPSVLSLDEEEDYLENLDREPELFVIGIDRARSRFDTILIDCPSSMGPATRAALLASDGYLVPIQAEELCRNSIEPLLDFVESFRDRSQLPPDSGIPNLHPLPTRSRRTPLVLEGIFLTMASAHTRMGRHVASKVAEDFGDLVFEQSIPRTTRLSEMAVLGKPAVIYDRRSPGSRAYFDLADALVQRYCLARESMGLSEDSTIPERVDPLAKVDPDQEETQIPKPFGDKLGGGNMDHFLADLISRAGAETSAPQPSGEPEIVSLDDLLAEEEDNGRDRKNGEEWDQGFWNMDSDDNDRFN